MASSRRVAKRALKSLLRRVQPLRFSDDPGWAIGLYAGTSPFDLAPLDGRADPIVHRDHLPGRGISTVADPFAVEVDGIWHLFYEVMDQRPGRGHLAVSTSRDLVTWEHRGPVLREPFHLSYPQIIRDRDDLVLVPEAASGGAVRLYRAVDFPTRWAHVTDLLRGPVLLDPTLFRTDDGWWMFVETSPNGRAGELRLFGAPRIDGPWSEHPASPVVGDDPRISRPAGPIVEVEGVRYRLAQDCSQIYGAAVGAVRIDRLDPATYQETALDRPVLAGSGAGWNAAAMHHLDLHAMGAGRWIAFVDGHG